MRRIILIGFERGTSILYCQILTFLLSLKITTDAGPTACSSRTNRPINRTLLLIAHRRLTARSLCRRRRSSECQANYKVIEGDRFCSQNWLLQDRKKNNFRSFIYGHISTNRANFVKIGPMKVEIIGLTKITKIFLKQQQKGPSSPALRAERVG